jgi:hypothetical protein
MATTETYSQILQDFIEPIMTKKESEDSYFDKCLLGHVVWNYCVSSKYKLPVAPDVYEVLKEKYLIKQETKKAVDLLTKRWKQSFSHYDRFIMRIERKYKNDSPTIYVETVSPEYFSVFHGPNSKFRSIPFSKELCTNMWRQWTKSI